MARGDVASGVSSSHYDPPLASRERKHGKIPLFPTWPDLEREEHRLSARKDLRKAVTDLAFAAVQPRNLLRLAAGSGDPPEA
jgi:hypothetical protein